MDVKYIIPTWGYGRRNMHEEVERVCSEVKKIFSV